MAETSQKNVEDSFAKRHHKQNSLSCNRPNYREARWERAVKVYTINLESKYILVQGVPAVGASKELVELFALYGAIDEYRFLDDYPTEPFTEVYWIKFQRINSARVAKKKLDNRSFFGGILHVCYAPEFETVDDTREKLQERRKAIAKKTRELFGVQQNDLSAEVSHSRETETSLKRSSDERTEVTNESHIENKTTDGSISQPRNRANVPSDSWLCSNSAEFTNSSSYPCYYYPTLPPPPQHLSLYQYPPPPPPWELPRVPSSHATLPLFLQNLPPPPPPPPPPSFPPPPPPTDGPPLEYANRREQGLEQEKPITVYMSQGMIGPQPEQGGSSNKASLTGDLSLDQTAVSIRKKMQKLSRTHEVSPSPAPSIQLFEKPLDGEQVVASVSKRKRKRI